MIDLHLHTNASDGCCAPEELIRRACEAGLRVVGVTDHDTMAGVPAADASARQCGLTVVGGIEVTAVLGTRDVHVLGYFLDPANDTLVSFLAGQRDDRLRRAKEIATRLDALGLPIDIEKVLQDAAAHPDRSVARPRIAVELTRAGHVGSPAEAFDRLIGEGRPAYVPRAGASPEAVVQTIRRAGGVAALAHPGLLGRDDLIESLVAAGMAAIEVHHPEHDEAARAHYAALARRYDLAVTGGTDYHGDASSRHAPLGSITLPAEDFERLRALAGAGAR